MALRLLSWVAAAAATAFAAAPVWAEAPFTSPAAAPTSPPPALANCLGGKCSYRMAPDQLLAVIENLVTARKYAEARPLVAALRHAPGMETPYNFLDGLVALETGDAKTAASRFRTILAKDPQQTRVRLELARALIAQGDRNAADYHLRLAQDDQTLPEDIRREITQARSVIRSKRDSSFGFDFGFAPDSNINSATNAETVDVNFGPTRLPLTLNEEARARSGTGQTANAYGALRLPASEHLTLVTNFDAAMVNYRGKDFDDFSAQLAIGPEAQLDMRTSLSIQGVGLYRWYGGRLAARQFGAKLTAQHDLSRNQRVGFQIDGRHSDSDFGNSYTGWQLGAVGTFEQVVAKSAIATASVFTRRDFMKVSAFANNSIGASLGLAGELPLGVNAGVSGAATYVLYDEPQYMFAYDSREDWRYQARAYMGMRKIRIYGFSPSVEYRYSKVDTNYEFYRSDRHRVEVKLARFF